MTIFNEDTEEFSSETKTTKTGSIYDTIIIGGGVAGLSAAIYSSRDGFSTLVLEGELMSNVDYPGGALMLTPDIENFPGFVGGEGSELIDILKTQAEKFGSQIVEERATQFDFANAESSDKIHTVYTTNNVYKTRSIILAMGATAKLLEVPGELEFYGKGVSTCATCDGFFFREKIVAVVGGGDTAIEDALFLTRYAKEVNLIVRGNKLKASGPQAREILAHPQVNIIWNTTVETIVGVNSVESVILKDTGDNLSELALDGVFVAIGRTPATESIQTSPVNIDSEGYIMVNGDSTHVMGNVVGVFAAGDVVDKVYRQAITSAGKAAQAALDSRHYLLLQDAIEKGLI